MGVMSKKMVSYRFPAETVKRLAVLSAYSEETQTGILVRLVDAAWQQRHPQISDPVAVQAGQGA